MKRAAVAVGAVLAACLAAASGCSTIERRDGLPAESIPPEEQADYAVFAARCSKCHSLARPLNSGITDDAYWRMYVERMRRQPGSGIRQEDTVAILRFLHWYSVEQKREPTRGDGG